MLYPYTRSEGWLPSSERGVETPLQGRRSSGYAYTLVERCAPLCVDVRSLWVDVRDTFPGVEELVLIDRFLDTVATRMKHAERMAEIAA